MPITVRPSGPLDAKLMLVGEAPGEMEEKLGEPFVGASGQELSNMLHEVGLARSQCFITNVARQRPPKNDIELWTSHKKHAPAEGWKKINGIWVTPEIVSGLALLRKEIELVQPRVIVAFGNVALWALTEKWGVTKWRGSTIRFEKATDYQLGRISPVIVPTYHPAGILRMMEWRSATVQDLRRAKQVLDRGLTIPNYNFRIRPNFFEVQSILQSLINHAERLPLRLAVDIETRAGHIACVGLAWNSLDALCIPFMRVGSEPSYWAEWEELEIVLLLQKLLTHPNIQIVGQNFSYDTQYFQRHFGFTPRLVHDTMISHHTLWPGTPKGLAYLSSLYCEYHVYWKDEGKEWERGVGEEQLWIYNCKDAVVTYEVSQVLEDLHHRLQLSDQHAFQQSMFWPVDFAMRKGLRRDEKERVRLRAQLAQEVADRQEWIAFVLGHPLNPGSSLQMKRLFYDDFRQTPILHKKTKQLTLDDDALALIARREPLLQPLVNKISELRSLGVFLSTFINSKLDKDGRFRCSYNIAGTETFRLSSSKNAFDSGGNLQNIPNKTDSTLELPNIRTLFIPDSGYEFFDLDLDRADLQVVAWEMNDEGFKRALHLGLDMHLYSARDIFKLDIPDDELVETHPQCQEHKRRHYIQRHKAKAGVHATNYGCKARTLASTLGTTVHEAERFQRLWFSAHPGLREWHYRVESELATRRSVTNAFGFRRFYFGRVDGLLPEALAWIPQSTVGITINEIWRRLFNLTVQGEPLEVLLQGHDSLAGQYPAVRAAEYRQKILQLSKVVIPYPDPLIIPTGLKVSTKSWGDCNEKDAAIACVTTQIG